MLVGKYRAPDIHSFAECCTAALDDELLKCGDARGTGHFNSFLKLFLDDFDRIPRFLPWRASQATPLAKQGLYHDEARRAHQALVPRFSQLALDSFHREQDQRMYLLPLTLN